MQLVTPGKNLSTSWSTAFITRLHRYKSLFLRRWWIPVLTTCLGLFVEAFLIYQMPPSYLSASKMMLAGKLNIAQGAVYSEDSVNFYGTQIQLMQSAQVKQSAEQLVRATHPEMQPVPVESRSRRNRAPPFLICKRSRARPITPRHISTPSCRSTSISAVGCARA